MPAALAAVWHAQHLLLAFDRHRDQWELPGGLLAPGETPWQAAVRELHEESGLHLPPSPSPVTDTSPDRPTPATNAPPSTPPARPPFVPNEETSAIRWWDSTTPTPHNAQILDTTLALQIR
ncbi:NUDIX hydrolase [Actinomadura sp. 3N508]|uniref:NUDIX hydrolase n=1 Tax=Actinomadura sp. 3N508 TaxID=3375153 RepID=UPI00378F5F12